MEQGESLAISAHSFAQRESARGGAGGRERRTAHARGGRRDVTDPGKTACRRDPAAASRLSTATAAPGVHSQEQRKAQTARDSNHVGSGGTGRLSPGARPGGREPGGPELLWLP